MTEAEPAAAPDEEAAGEQGESPRPKRVLLIGWDAADWKIMQPLIDRGEMPAMKRFIDEGVSGNIATLQPALSPMLWTSVATGKLADKHGVLGFAEPDGTTGKSRPVTSTSRQCKAIWNILSERGRPAGAINWYASHPAEKVKGFVVTDRFAHPTGPLKPDEPLLGWKTIPRSVWPEDDLEPLAKVRVHPAMISREMVAEFIPKATDDESARWPKVAELRGLLAHCATVHNAATAYMDAEDWDFCGIYYDAIDRFAHAFMEFHPPRMAHVSDEDFERYSGIMDQCYRFHDMMLSRLMGMIDEDTAVCIVSDHGFHSDHLRPSGTSAIKDGQPVAWHRPYGIVAFWGPGIKKNEKLYGASLLDITPTMLNLIGEPVAEDMDGRPLLQIWEEAPKELDRVPTFEGGETDDAEVDADDAAVSEKMLDQLRQLGYLGEDDAEGVTIDRMRNLGIVYLSTGRPAEAAQQFEQILERRPEDKGTKLSLVSALMGTGDLERCEALAAELQTEDVDRPRIELLRAMIAARRGDDEKSLEHLRAVEKLDPTHHGLQTHLGQAFVKRKLWEDAERAFDKALQTDHDDATALDGLGTVYRETGRPAEAVLAHMRSIALEHHRPMSHLGLAKALFEVERYPWALDAIAITLRMAPGLIEPHELAAAIYEKRGQKRKAAFHRKRLEQIKERHAALREQAEAGEQSPTQQVGTSRATLKFDTPAAGVTGTREWEPSNGPITIVSGLPRSGTSLMMQMLEAGGVPPLTDAAREADEDNPRGYYELEAVKTTARDPSWLVAAGGKAVKMIHALLRTLPDDRDYRVVFMRRDLGEIVASQQKMLDRHKRAGGGLDAETLRAAYEQDLNRVLTRTGKRKNIELIQVSYNELLTDPRKQAERLAATLGGDLDINAMAAVVDSSLYRNRATT